MSKARLRVRLRGMFDISAPSRVSHSAIDPAVLYLGTPVVLVVTSNIDGSTNVAPMSSAWWLGWSCMLGFDATSHTVANLERAGESSGLMERVSFVVGTDRAGRPPRRRHMEVCVTPTSSVQQLWRRLSRDPGGRAVLSAVAVHGITDDGAPVIEGCVLMKISPPNPQEESFDVIRNFR